MTETSIEYEQITIKVPKQIMELLRFAQKATNETPGEFIETTVLKGLRGDLDADALIPNEDLAETFQLKPIYKELLGGY